MKRGICIGLNYENTPYELDGCALDARAMKTRMQAAVKSYSLTQFQEFTSVFFADTLFSLLNSVQRASKPSDTFYLTFSGHGTQIPGNEPDGLREGICLFNGNMIEVVRDSDLSTALAQIPGTVIVIFDSCFSGGMSRKPTLHRRKFIEYDPQRMFTHEVKKTTGAKAIQANKLYYLNACAEEQVSYDTGRGGLFTLGLVNAYDKAAKPQRSIKSLMHGAELFCKPYQSPFYQCYGGTGAKRIF